MKAMKRLVIIICVYLFTGFGIKSSVLAGDFSLHEGDRVVFLGSTLIEREQRYGYWETMLTARNPNKTQAIDRFLTP